MSDIPYYYNYRDLSLNHSIQGFLVQGTALWSEILSSSVADGLVGVHIVFMKSSQDMVTSTACPFVRSLGPSLLIISEEIHFIFLVSILV
jgi:hypothetical protein